MQSFAEQLKALGYEVTDGGDKVSFPFKIQTGRRAGDPASDTVASRVKCANGTARGREGGR